ncbi:MAG: GNAT family N-acetyltransferase, partial [Thermomicrobiales bacterium]
MQLATSLEETPETMNGIHRLRRGIAHAYIAGTPDNPAVAVVQSRFLMEEPAAYGNDPELVWAVLKQVPGWTAVNAEREVAPKLAALIKAESGKPCLLIEEMYYTLDRPVTVFSDPVVRRIELDDLAMVEAATEPLSMHGWRFGSAEALLSEGLLAGAVIDGELVSIAFSASASSTYCEVGIKTREDFRGRGYSTAAASLICAEIQANGQTVVWSTDQDN